MNKTLIMIIAIFIVWICFTTIATKVLGDKNSPYWVIGESVTCDFDGVFTGYIMSVRRTYLISWSFKEEYRVNIDGRFNGNNTFTLSPVYCTFN